MINNKLILCVDHKLFFKKEDFDTIASNHFIETEGISMPVWLNAANGKTSEPAREIFSKYTIYNDSNSNPSVNLYKNYYEIFLPQIGNWKPPPEIDYKKLSEMTLQQRFVFEQNRNIWWERNPKPPCLESMLENKSIKFEVKKIEDYNDIKIIIKHTVQINSIDILNKSIVN